ncbi:hypothetical protein [Aurantibacillus circumpalustris]|uniref:hypothetical protein n=1 Tax=Aurantibacillus circumpalustris TaxID=3036359 RepID=UPI00295A9DC2|nr:hypothetical protein [Aurantibacillus circumpalustris]
MKNKKWLLLIIIAFPSFFWLILETSTINSSKLPFYGPKKVLSLGSDTIYHTVPDSFYLQKEDIGALGNLNSLNTTDFPLYAIIFISNKYRADSYRLTGLWEYLNYKKEKVVHIPFALVTEHDGLRSQAYSELKKLNVHSNVHFYNWKKNGFDSLAKIYFAGKPYYIDYSFFLLIDQNRHIRGYYDGRYVSEIKRLIGEYQHLRLKEEKQKLIESNEIKSDS